jgi:hypothetical protein
VRDCSNKEIGGLEKIHRYSRPAYFFFMLKKDGVAVCRKNKGPA